MEDEKKKGVPGPGTYTMGTQFFDPENHQDADKLFPPQGGKVYVDNNCDRFGRPILPRKPRELVPGPGEYNTGKDVDEPIKTMGGYMPQAQNVQGPPKEKGLPGPAFYNAAVEPKKISFLFNAAEKWTT